MLLAIDVGNTNVTLGVFDGKNLKDSWRIATTARHMADEYGLTITNLLGLGGITPSDVTDICLCSVVPPITATLEDMCAKYFKITPLTVSAGVKTGMPILYQNPRDVGADRVVDAVAAFHLYKGPLIVVDFGTAIVFDAISAHGEYLGGAIAPGINVAAESLFLSTSQLRRVELEAPTTAIGRNTVASMQSGLIFGYIDLVTGMVKRFKEELGADSKVVATGGMASLMAAQTDIFDTVNEDLTLIGLHLIHKLNQTTGPGDA